MTYSHVFWPVGILVITLAALYCVQYKAPSAYWRAFKIAILINVISIGTWGSWAYENAPIRHVITDYGLKPGYSCIFGVLNDRDAKAQIYVPVTDANKNPIKCSGEIEVSRNEAKEWRL